mmetsp:Transcript_136875/g.437904  ORF Transcript_136875/g.437904 Transcript_136875/m.437904 type:complete len:201 (-) Transcript_136875:642-1244(-)
MTTGSPAPNVTGSATPLILAVAPSFAAMRIAMFAFVSQTSKTCGLPAFTITTRVSPKPLAAMSATAFKALQVFSKPLPSLQPLPSLVRLINVMPFSRAATSSFSASMPPLEINSWTAADLPADTTASVGKLRTYIRLPFDVPLPLLVSSLNFLALREGSMPAMRLSRLSKAWSTNSEKDRSCDNTGTCFMIIGRNWPVFP